MHWLKSLIVVLSMAGVSVAEGIDSMAHVRIAELEIEANRLDAYLAAVKEEIEVSIKSEPGVIAIYSVALKDKPTHLRFFEIYADESAYRSHIASPHFKKYVDLTKGMIKSRELFETSPVILGSKKSDVRAVRAKPYSTRLRRDGAYHGWNER